MSPFFRTSTPTPPPAPANAGRPSDEDTLPPLELRILAPPTPGRRDLRVWGAGILAVFLLTAVASPYFQEPVTFGEAPAGFPHEDELPLILRPSYERALKGDASAMRVMGAVYLRGEYLPRDERKAAAWYRCAAAAGAPEAAGDLERLGAPPPREP